MEPVRITWIITFFFFALILIFVWSKILVITNKVKNINSLIEKSRQIKGEMIAGEPGTGKPEGKA